MDPRVLARLQTVTPEEQKILDGSMDIDRALYMQGQENRIIARKLLKAGSEITVRPHTRFVRFPAHNHDYVEVVYMLDGRTTHIIDGKELLLEKGQLLFLSPQAVHAIEPAGQQDVALNFIILPEFFSKTLPYLGQSATPLRSFLVDCLCGRNTEAKYLHFAVSGVVLVENLIENLLCSLLEEGPGSQELSRLTMALLFAQLERHTDKLRTGGQEDAAVLLALQNIENDYAESNFRAICQQMRCDMSWLSRQIKKHTGKTYTQLLQQRRLRQAAFLLRTTNRKVSDIAQSVGYENLSYFHRIFADCYGCSPKHYRDGL